MVHERVGLVIWVVLIWMHLLAVTLGPILETFTSNILALVELVHWLCVPLKVGNTSTPLIDSRLEIKFRVPRSIKRFLLDPSLLLDPLTVSHEPIRNRILSR